MSNFHYRGDFMRRLTAALGVLLILLLFTVNAYGLEMSLHYDNEWHSYSAPDINLVINGKKVVTKEMPPIALMNRTLVPVREVFESIGGKVEWVQETDQVRITYNGSELLFTLNSRNIYVGRSRFTIPTGEPTPMAINNKTMVPIRIIADLLGFEVEWDGETGTVYLVDSNAGDSDKKDDKKDEQSSAGEKVTKGKISKVDLKAENNSDLIYLTYGSPVEPKIYRYNSPERVVLDFEGTQLADGYSELLFKDGSVVTSVRGANHDNMARIVLDVKSQPNIVVGRTDTGLVIAASKAGKSYTTKIEDLNGGELFDPSDIDKNSDPDPNDDDSLHLDTTGTVDTTNTRDFDYGSVVIDPGHGGYDPGALGGNAKEKDIALAISLKVRDKLEAAGYNVVMTRDSDTYPTLQDRVDIASKKTDGSCIPALYVSIHCNSLEKPETNGTQVWFHPDSKYGTILAENIYNRNVANTTLRPGQVHDGSSLYVIRKTLQPAALVETAFISNDSDRAYLTSEDGQEALATGIYEGIIQTMEQMKKDKGIK